MYLLYKLLLMLYVAFATVEASVIQIEDLGEVIFVNVIYRHGARTPINTYRNDPYKEYFTEGFGELTNVGRNQQFELGKWLRQRYQCLLPDKYSPQLIHVMSSDKDRVLMSALCNLAGMYPPKGNQVWNRELNWQPIPVHALPEKHDKIMGMTAPCPAYDEELKKVLESKEVKEINVKYQYVVDILNNNTGETRHDYKYISNMYDILFVQSQYNLVLPKWSKSIFPQPMEEATVLKCSLPTWNKKLVRLNSGPLLQEIIKNMETKINTKSKSVMHVYSAHDSTIVNLLNALNVWDKKLAPYAACVMLELRRDSCGAPHVTLFYRTSAEQPPRLLTIPGCAAACPLDRFIAITEPLIPQDWDKECQNTK